LKIIAKLIFHFLRLIFGSKQGVVLENLALRQQLAVQQRSIKRPKIKNTDRIFWICLSRIWDDWKSALIVVKPKTVALVKRLLDTRKTLFMAQKQAFISPSI